MICLTIVCALLIGTSSFAGTPENTSLKTNVTLIEENLLQGINSENLGLKVSAAYYLGEYKTEKAVLPLMKMLHSEKNESCRIQAALSLIKIGNPKGVFMVKQAAKFDQSERVRNMCSKFYNAYQKS